LNCGARLAARCPQCAAELPPEAKFCPACGAKVEPAPAPPAAAPGPDELWARLERLMPAGYAERLRQTRGPASAERRLVTILFADVKGSTAMAERLDPEDVLEIMNGAFEGMIAPIFKHDGTLARLMGDAILAFFGAPLSHEDDPECAVRAALEIVANIRGYAQRLEQERGLHGFGVRVGLNTGQVVVGEVGSDLRVEYTAMGDAINLAARMEQAAPVGGVLLAPHTYALVRNLFEIEALEPVMVKGKSEPIPVYLALRARPRAFYMAERGFETLETPLVGRASELLLLQEAFNDALEAQQTRLVTLVGEAGVGKSRLLAEFESWLQAQPGKGQVYYARATPEMQAAPYSLLRDLFVRRFAIQESDPPAEAQRRLRAGLAGQMAAEQADLIGQLVGFDFRAGAGQAAAGLLGAEGSSDLVAAAEADLRQYFRSLASPASAAGQARPAVTLLLLEDLHWADDSALDFIQRWAAETPAARLLIIGLARPVFFERRPHWGEGQAAYTQVEIRPLSARYSRALVSELLRGLSLEALPAELATLLIEGTNGNPYHIEELFKMLVERRVLVAEQEPTKRDEPWTPAWRVIPERLAGLKELPATLTGVLQARLDTLPPAERELAQQAAVVGERFWDTALAQLNPASSAEKLQDALQALRRRQLITEHALSQLQGTRQFAFKHNLLHAVTYESVLLKTRRAYHAQVAAWLEQTAGKRLSEHALLIAEHYERAEQPAKAAELLRQAGDQALKNEHFDLGIQILERALALWPAEAAAQRAPLLCQLGYCALRLSQLSQAKSFLDESRALAEKCQDIATWVRSLVNLSITYLVLGDYVTAESWAEAAIALAQAQGEALEQAVAWTVRGRIALSRQQYAAVREQCSQGLAICQAAGLESQAARLLRNRGDAAFNEKHYAAAQADYEEALVIYRKLGNRYREIDCFQELGSLASEQRDFAAAETHFRQMLAIAQALNHPGKVAGAHTHLGFLAYARGQYLEAESYHRQALSHFEAEGEALDAAINLYGLGQAAAGRNELAQGLERQRQALVAALGVGSQQFTPWVLAALGGLLARARQAEAAARCLGLANSHPASDASTAEPTAEALGHLHARLTPEALAAAQAKGQTMSWQAAVDKLLAGATLEELAAWAVAQ
jgi:class 3 adenylate cyclase